MATLEERVAYLEGQVSEQSHAMLEVGDAVRSLDQRMDRRFETVERRIDALDQGLSRRVDALDHELSHRIDTLDEKVSRQFVWLAGVQVTTLVAIVAALLARG